MTEVKAFLQLPLVNVPKYEVQQVPVTNHQTCNTVRQDYLSFVNISTVVSISKLRIFFVLVPTGLWQSRCFLVRLKHTPEYNCMSLYPARNDTVSIFSQTNNSITHLHTYDKLVTFSTGTHETSPGLEPVFLPTPFSRPFITCWFSVLSSIRG